MAVQFHVQYPRVFHVKRAAHQYRGVYHCQGRWRGYQVSNYGVIFRDCAEPVELAVWIVTNAPTSWNYYCPLHGRLKIEELQADLLAEDEPEPGISNGFIRLDLKQRN